MHASERVLQSYISLHADVLSTFCEHVCNTVSLILSVAAAAVMLLKQSVRVEYEDLQGDFTCSAVGALKAGHPKGIHQALSQPEGHHLRYGQGQPLQAWQGVHEGQGGGGWGCWGGGGGWKGRVVQHLLCLLQATSSPQVSEQAYAAQQVTVLA